MSDNQVITSDSLAVIYRPNTLEEVVGNESIVSQVRGWLKKGRFPNAILLVGAFGMGKTTMARVIARYVNCDTNTSCGTCRSCIGMASMTNMDYSELNMGANGTKDEVKDMLSSLGMMPRANLRIKVLDEAHAMTTQAKDALLKTLEEPPAKSMFILCTNKPDKLLDTIRSRCTRLEMKAPTEEQMAKHLWTVATKEGHDIPRTDTDGRAVLFEIAKLSGGHLRDSLQMLESYLAVRDSGDQYTVEDIIKNYFGSSDQVLDLVALNVMIAMATGQAKRVVAELVEQKEHVFGLIYKMRFIAQNLMAVWASVAKYQTPSTKEYVKQVGSININYLTNVSMALSSVEQTIITCPGADGLMLLQSACLNSAILEARRLQAKAAG